MITIASISDLRQVCRSLPRPLGLVPTMGYLHAGHLSLVQAARQSCASVTVSIFVNPTQFGPKEDLAAYPRDLPRDSAMLAESGVDVLWTPTAAEMYPSGYQTWVDVTEVTRVLEGAIRPGHFRGVATVVSKLFNAVQPDLAFFGQKDAQQVVVIRQMVRDLNFPLELVICPTGRDPDGLAMSSRNTYLNVQERQAATILYCSLQAAKGAFDQGQLDAEALRQVMLYTLSQEPLADVQYVSCADPQTLAELEGPVERALFSMAVKIGKTRLIDNFVFDGQTWLTGQAIEPRG